MAIAVNGDDTMKDRMSSCELTVEVARDEEVEVEGSDRGPWRSLRRRLRGRTDATRA